MPLSYISGKDYEDGFQFHAVKQIKLGMENIIWYNQETIWHQQNIKVHSLFRVIQVKL